MKQLLYYFTGICLLALTAGCSNWLVLMPEDSTIEEEFWQNGNQVETVVRACYRYMQEDDMLQRMLLYGELRSDEVQNGSAISSSESEIINANVRSSNSWCNWASFYRVINYCNKVIEKAPAVMELDANFKEATCQAYLAEAMTIRALCYFYLVRTFQNVPLVLTSSKTDEYDYNVSNQDTAGWIAYYKLPVEVSAFRSESYTKVTQEFYVLDRMIESLHTALAYATTTWNSEAETHGRVTRMAVEALLADMYLWRGSILHTISLADAKNDYESCIKLCRSIRSEARELEMEWEESGKLLNKVFYSGNSMESVFELNFTTSGHANSATSAFYGNTNKSVNPKLMAAVSLPGEYNPNLKGEELGYDCRSKDFFIPSSYRIFKYEGQTPPSEFGSSSYSFRGSSSQSNWIFYRLADVCLMEAEAMAASEMDVDAVVTLCNKTYIRACTLNGEVRDSLSHSAYSTPSDALKLVFKERKRELCFEGKRYFDLLRLARRNGSTAQSWDLIEPRYEEDVTTIRNKMSKVEAWYLPIYHNEMSINTRLRQNEYYKGQGD